MMASIKINSCMGITNNSNLYQTGDRHLRQKVKKITVVSDLRVSKNQKVKELITNYNCQ